MRTVQCAVRFSTLYRLCFLVDCLSHIMEGSNKNVREGVRVASPASGASSAKAVPDIPQVDVHTEEVGGALSAVRAQCNYLGVWPYRRPMLRDHRGIIVTLLRRF